MAPPMHDRSTDHLVDVVSMLPVGVLRWDRQGRVELCNVAAARLFASLDDAVPRRGPDDLLGLLEAAHPGVRRHVAEVADRGPLASGLRVRLGTRGGAPVVGSVSLIRPADDHVLAVLTDVTAEVAKERAIEQAEGQLRTVFQHLPGHALLSLDDEGRVQGWTASAEQLYGRPASSVLGRSGTLVLPLDTEAQLRRLLADVVERGRARARGWVDRAGGSAFWAVASLARFAEDATVTGFSVLVHDDSERRQEEEALERAATTDPLTGLMNRRVFVDNLERSHHLWQRYQTPYSLLLIDADHFKAVNDTYGHDVGDVVLQRLAGAVRETCRQSDLIARYGGEEFAVLCWNTRRKDAVRLGERLREAVGGLVVEHGGSSVRFTISVGVAEVAPGEEASVVVTRADQALYRSKHEGRDRVSAS